MDQSFYKKAAEEAKVQFGDEEKLDWSNIKARIQGAKERLNSQSKTSTSIPASTLKSGAIVEAVMKDIAMETPFKHQEDLEEIRDIQVVEFDEPLPKALYDYLHSFEGIISAKQHFCITLLYRDLTRAPSDKLKHAAAFNNNSKSHTESE
ncbi:hypothetical protein BDC45DRAFT_565028 [Circinella umbellata]|nr:hypothetical protein BDC45DRAFT_565028 [Circinella umbellata]